MEVMYPQSSGLDVHQKFVLACVYVRDKKGREKAIRQRFNTMTHGLEELVEWLLEHEITHVAMESTGVYWKPVYNILSPHVETWVVNARHLKQVPGRKTDDTDAMWITKLMRYGLLSPSFIADREQDDLRDLTRYRTRLQQERSSAVNRVQKALEKSNIKLKSVVSDIQGVSARLMIEALIEGETEPEVMAKLAKGSLRNKIPELTNSLRGNVREHDRFMLKELLLHIDELNHRIESVDNRIKELTHPHLELVERLCEVTGVGVRTAEIILAEIGASVDKWPSDRHLAAWACLCPGNNESGGKRRSSTRRRGQSWLVPALVEAAWAASRTKETYLCAQFHRIRARRGAKRAAVAVAHSIVKIVYHLIKNPEERFHDLGGDYFIKKNKKREEQRAVKTLEKLGYQVGLNPVSS